MGCHDNDGTEDCPLCKRYYHHACDGCPISQKKTGLAFCDGTPLDDMPIGHKTGVGADLSNMIEAEIEFLISLLTQEDQDNLEALHREWCLEKRK